MAAVIAAVVCCAGTTLLLAFGAGTVLTSVGATVGKPQMLLPGLALLVATIAVVLARRQR